MLIFMSFLKCEVSVGVLPPPIGINAAIFFTNSVVAILLLLSLFAGLLDSEILSLLIFIERLPKVS